MAMKNPAAVKVYASKGSRARQKHGLYRIKPGSSQQACSDSEEDTDDTHSARLAQDQSRVGLPGTRNQYS
jgi:hypothetical protein